MKENTTFFTSIILAKKNRKICRGDMLDYDLNFNPINMVFYSPENMINTKITPAIYIDRTSIEVS